MCKIDCHRCSSPQSCCQEGVSIDLGEAVKILSLGLPGEFFHLAKDRDFPSGYRIDTSFGTNPCTFLTKEGLCSIHKIDYALKPTPCKEFPYNEDGSLSSDVTTLCALYKQRTKRQRK
jgi:hypothetical protein